MVNESQLKSFKRLTVEYGNFTIWGRVTYPTKGIFQEMQLSEANPSGRPQAGTKSIQNVVVPNIVVTSESSFEIPLSIYLNNIYLS